MCIGIAVRDGTVKCLKQAPGGINVRQVNAAYLRYAGGGQALLSTLMHVCVLSCVFSTSHGYS